MSDFSVIVPAYNGAAFIGDALRSVFAQTLLPREIIIVDDCSTDSTCEVVNSLIAESPVPLRLMRLDENSGGPARPINVGIAAATGGYITVLDQDDLFVPTRLETHAAALDTFSGASIAFSWCGALCESGAIQQKPWLLDEIMAAVKRAGPFYRIAGAVFFRLLLTLDNFVWGYAGFSFRRRAWLEKGGVDESLRIASDYDLLFWLATRGDAMLVPIVGYCRRGHEANLSRDVLKMRHERDIVRIRSVREHADLFPNENLRSAAARAVLRDLGGARQAGNYLECLRFSSRLLGLWGANVRTLRWQFGLPLHWCYRRAQWLVNRREEGRR